MVVSATQITASVSVASGATVGPVTATVSNPDGSSATGGTLQIGLVPTITGVLPASVLEGSTTILTVTGTGFDSGAKVSFSGTGVTGTTSVNSATSLSVTAAITATAATTARDVTVTDGDGQTATLSAALTVVSHSAGSLYAADNTSSNVGVYAIANGGQLTQNASAAAQTNPQGVSVTPDGRSVYVDNCASNSISQYAVSATGTLTPLGQATVPTSGTCPRGSAISPNGRYLYVAENGTNSGASGSAVQWFSIGTAGALTPAGTITTNLTIPNNVAVTPDGNALYVTNASGANGTGSGTVAEFTIASGGGLTAAGSVTAGTLPFGIAVSSDGRDAYVTNQSSGTISEYTITNDTLTALGTLMTGATPEGLAISPDAKGVYVAANGAGAVYQYTVGATGALTAKAIPSVATSLAPFAVALTPDGQYAYAGAFTSASNGSMFEFGLTSGGLSALSPASLASAANLDPYALAVDEPIQIGTSATLTTAARGTPYSAPLWTLAGTAPVTFALTQGSLPSGLTLSGSTISGTPTATGTYTFTVSATDASTVAQTVMKQFTLLVTAPPTQTISLASATNAALNGTTLYFDGTKAGAVQLKDTVTATTSGATAASAAFPAISATGWTHAAETITTPAGGPFTSTTLTWTASPSTPTGYSVTGADSNGPTVSTPLTFVNDSTAPTGGALTVNGTAATAAGSSSSVIAPPFTINSRTDYTEAQSSTASGLASSTLTLQSFSGGLTGCGSTPAGPYATPTIVTGTTQPSGITGGYCYRYTLTGTDNVNNAASISTTVNAVL